MMMMRQSTKKLLWRALFALGWLLAIVILLTGCSTFESFSLRFKQEIAYGDTAVEAEGAAAIADIEADKEVMMQANEPHTVNVQFPGEMIPATGPPIEAPAEPPKRPGMATMSDGTELYDCVPAKGGLIECQSEPAQ